MPAEIGTGTTITFSSGFFAEIVALRHNGIERPAIDQSHFGSTTARSFRPGALADMGELEIECHFRPSLKPPINAAAESITITFPDSGAATWQFSGFLTAFEYGGELEGKLTGTGRIKVAGDITVTP
jgi:hypothetical protein